MMLNVTTNDYNYISLQNNEQPSHCNNNNDNKLVIILVIMADDYLRCLLSAVD